MAQADFAKSKGLTLNAAKSRLQRTRFRMKQQMTLVCQVQVDTKGHVLDFVPRQ
jgi:RNA polymerase sigma-70 factor (ECF subfamily)